MTHSAAPHSFLYMSTSTLSLVLAFERLEVIWELVSSRSVYFKVAVTFACYYFPCSGLDSTSSLMVVDALKAVAEERKLTIVCVIHQPRYEIFSESDLPTI